jgi:hypothetical protein
MKTLLRISLIVAVLFASVNVYALDETFALKVKSNSDKSVMFYINQAQDVDLSIYNSDNDILYKQTIHANQPAAKTYNLDSFPDGSYLFKLETSNQITEYQVVIEDGKTVVSKPVTIEKFKPSIKFENSMITFTLDNADKGPVEVKILNEYNDSLYEKVFNVQSKLSKKFNVGQTDAKELTFIVRFNNQEYVETVSIK